MDPRGCDQVPGPGAARSGMDPAAAAGLLEELADRALASEFEPVACLEAPEPAEVPAGLRRADGRSVYPWHGGTRYVRVDPALADRPDVRGDQIAEPGVLRQRHHRDQPGMRHQIRVIERCVRLRQAMQQSHLPGVLSN